MTPHLKQPCYLTKWRQYNNVYSSPTKVQRNKGKPMTTSFYQLTYYRRYNMSKTQEATAKGDFYRLLFCRWDTFFATQQKELSEQCTILFFSQRGFLTFLMVFLTKTFTKNLAVIGLKIIPVQKPTWEKTSNRNKKVSFTIHQKDIKSISLASILWTVPFNISGFRSFGSGFCSCCFW